MADLSIERLNELAELLVNPQNDEWAPEDRWVSLLEAACEFDAARIQEVCAFVRQCKNFNVDLELEIVVENSPEGLPIGTQIDRYTLIREIDSGGMGIVYEASFSAGDMVLRSVALKMIKSGNAEEALARRLRAETNLLSRLDDQNIVKILDAGRTEWGAPYFVMELIDGGLHLDKYCAGLPLADRIEVFKKLCAVVQVVHDNNIVHRDMKPRNILITKAGEPKLLDFGLAAPIQRIEDAPSCVNTEPGPNGTKGRMGPQQEAGDRPSVTDDIFSLGTILRDLVKDHESDDNSSVVEKIRAIVARCMASEPTERFQTAAALSAASSEVVSDLQASGAPVSRPSRAPFHRFKSLIGLGVTAALLVAGFFAYDHWSKRQASLAALTRLQDDLDFEKRQEDRTVNLTEKVWATLLQPITGVDVSFSDQERRTRTLIENGDINAKERLAFVYIHCRATILQVEKDAPKEGDSSSNQPSISSDILERIPDSVIDRKAADKESRQTAWRVVRHSIETMKSHCSDGKAREGLDWWREIAPQDPTGRVAAELSQLLAAGSLSVMQDQKEAYKWATSSAAAGNPDGIDVLGDLLLEGVATTENDDLAVAQWERAARLGSLTSQIKFAKALDGEGPNWPVNKARAFFWAAVAAANDQGLLVGRKDPLGLNKENRSVALRLREKLKAELPATEVRRILAAAKLWKPEIRIQNRQLQSRATQQN